MAQQGHSPLGLVSWSPTPMGSLSSMDGGRVTSEGSPKLLSGQCAAPAILAPFILPATPATVKKRYFMHFNQCFILDPCPRRASYKGKSLKIEPINTKEIKHQRQAGGQAAESCAWSLKHPESFPGSGQWGTLSHQTSTAEGCPRPCAAPQWKGQAAGHRSHPPSCPGADTAWFRQRSLTHAVLCGQPARE